MRFGGKVEDYMPWPKEAVVEQPVATPEQVLALLSSMVRKKD